MQLNEIISINRGVSANVRAKLEECTFVGIDFGTSTTTVTRLVYDSDMQQVMSAPMMIAQADASGVEIESHLVPTVVATTGGGRLIFGEGAKACLLNEETYAEGYRPNSSMEGKTPVFSFSISDISRLRPVKTSRA